MTGLFHSPLFLLFIESCFFVKCCLFLALQHLLQVRSVVGGVGRMQLELLHQQVQHVGGDKGGQVRTQVDVLDVQVQQSQQDGDGLLFEPRDGVVDGQLVDVVHLQGLGQRQGDLHCAVTVVTLADIQQTRNAVGQGAPIVAVDAEFAATHGQGDGVLGQVVAQVGEVVALLVLRAVAAADDEDVLQVAGLNGLDDLVGDREHGVVTETDQERVAGGRLLVAVLRTENQWTPAPWRSNRRRREERCSRRCEARR